MTADDPVLQALVTHGLVEPDGTRWRLTERGASWYSLLYVLVRAEIDAEIDATGHPS
jgi:hypothetical protein